MENRRSQPDAIVALGNPFMGDEGIGPFLLDRLRKDSQLPSQVDLIDTTGNILTALHALSNRRKVMFLDCALMGLKPGDFRLFHPSQAQTEKNLPGLFLHEGDLLGMLRTSGLLGESAEEVLIFGVEPERVEPKQGLSATLSSRLDQYLSEILREFKNQV